MRSLGLVMAAAVICLPAVAADFSGDGTGDIAIFRPGSGLWAVRGATRIYFGTGGDLPIPGDYEGGGVAAVGIFRPASGLWAIRGVTRVYFGGADDEARPGDYTGDGTSDIAIFRESSGLWAVRGVTRVYFGSTGDEAIVAGPVRAPVRTVDHSTTSQAAGYYEVFDLAAVDPGLDAGNIKSGVTVFGVEGNVLEASGTAGAAQVLEGYTFSRAGEVGVTGTMADQGSQTWTPGTSDQNLDAGYYGGGTVSGDADLVTGNIRSGVSIFGVDGDPSVVDTSSGDAVAGDILDGKVAWVNGAEVTGTMLAGRLLKTGQTASARVGDDGYYQKGIAFSYQTADPAGNGEIVTTDNVTGLIWASAGNGAGCNWGSQTNWNAAIDWAEGLTFAGYSDWRLPNRRELESIVDSSTYSHSINTTYFPNTFSGYYWSGSTYADDTTGAWFVGFGDGYVDVNGKTNAGYVRAVRGGE